MIQATIITAGTIQKPELPMEPVGSSIITGAAGAIYSMAPARAADAVSIASDVSEIIFFIDIFLIIVTNYIGSRMRLCINYISFFLATQCLKQLPAIRKTVWNELRNQPQMCCGEIRSA